MAMPLRFVQAICSEAASFIELSPYLVLVATKGWVLSEQTLKLIAASTCHVGGFAL